MILEESERVIGFKVYDSNVGRIWDLYSAFGWGTFPKHVKEFDWTSSETSLPHIGNLPS